MSIDLIEPWVRHAIAQVEEKYGHIISVEQKKASLLKFGRNEAVGTTTETVWSTGGNETYASTNAIDSISSSDDTDTQDIVITGHTIDGSGNFAHVEQTITLVGQTKTPLSTPLARVSRGYNDSSTDLAGTVYIYEDDTISVGVPDTQSKIHLEAIGDDNQSLKAAVTLGNDECWFISDIYGVVDQRTSAAVEFDIQWREKGKAFRTRLGGAASSDGPAFNPVLRPFLIVPSNADFRIRAKASTSNVAVEAWANGLLAKIIT